MGQTTETVERLFEIQWAFAALAPHGGSAVWGDDEV